MAAKVICKGNARKFKQRVSGRRNSYGMVMGQRTGDWQSGCPLAFATYFRTNTHTLPNYRLPPNPKTHDDENCTRQCYNDERSVKVVQKLAQRASREMTGYHSGYTYKAQRTQKGTLDTAFQSLTYFEKIYRTRSPPPNIVERSPRQPPISTTTQQPERRPRNSIWQ